MAEEMKRFPPTALKLERLRSSGTVPYSKAVMCFAVVLGALVGAIVSLPVAAASIAALARDAWSASSGSEWLRNEPASKALALSAAQISRALAKTVLSFVVPFFAIVLLLGALQTKFLFSFALFQPGMARFFKSGGWIWDGARKRLLAAGAGAVVVAVWAAASCVLLYTVLPAKMPAAGVGRSVMLDGGNAPGNGVVSTALSDNTEFLTALSLSARLDWAKGLFMSVWQTALFFSLFAGVCGYVAVWLAFRQEHRMSRAELEAEYRETDQAPEMKSAHRERGEAPPGAKSKLR